MPTWIHESAAWTKGIHTIAGVDEAGRGPWAGPVVAAAVILPRGWNKKMPEELRQINDSKKLGEKARAKLFEKLTTHPEVRWAVGACTAKEIDESNILRATHVAMRKAIENLNIPVDLALVDGLPVKDLPCPHEAIVKGDQQSWSISAASIIAKVSRDREMLEHDQTWPVYGFGRHKGYGTQQHQKALKQAGCCPIHRKSFAPVRKVAQ